jgi:hypothetical protein
MANIITELCIRAALTSELEEQNVLLSPVYRSTGRVQIRYVTNKR